MKIVPVHKFVSLLVAFAFLFATSCRGPMESLNGGGGIDFGGGDPNIPTKSPIKHVVVLIFQNRSFDHLFTKFTPPSGQSVNVAQPGDPGYTQTNAGGQSVSPAALAPSQAFTTDLNHGLNNYLQSWNNGAMNGFAAEIGDLAMGYYDADTPGMTTIWSYAQEYALADNYFSSVMSTAPVQGFYMVSATDNDKPFSTQPVFGPCQEPDAAAYPNTARNVGDQMSQKNVGWGWFHENLGICNIYVQQQNPFQYFVSTHSSDHIMDLAVFNSQVESNKLPSVSFVQMSPSRSGHPGSSSITAAAEYLDSFVKQMQASAAWESTAIFVVWDEGGGWYDHVPPPQVDDAGLGIRVPMMVISPHVKKGTVFHGLADHTSILKFIQWNWDMPSLNSRNSLGAISDLRAMFNF